MKPNMSILDRYGSKQTANTLIEYPKTIDRRRVLSRARTWYEGNGARRIPVFADALKASWKAEKEMIAAGGVIYKPYMISQ